MAMITRSYVTYPDAVEVPDYLNAFIIRFIALIILAIGSLLVFALVLYILSSIG